MITLAQLAQRYGALYSCGCAYTLPIIIILLSGTGIVVGAITYYFLSKSFDERKREFNKNKKEILKFLELDEQKIITAILATNGEITQAQLANKTNLDRVKVFRIIERLEQKKIIKKEKIGKTNKIKLTEAIEKIFK